MRPIDPADPHTDATRHAPPTDMSTPNPLAPQGSLLEQHPKGRSMFHVISFIGVVHIMLLCGILWTACGRDEKKVEPTNTLGNDPYGTPGTPPTDPVPAVPPGGNTASNLTSTLPIPTPGAPGAVATQPPGPSGNPGAATLPPGGTSGNSAGSPPVPVLPPAATTTSSGGSSPTAVDTAPVSAGPGGDYKVAKGDIGASIARKHGVSVKALVAANPSVNWSKLKVGQTIQIPAGGSTAGSPAPVPATTDTGVGGAPSTGSKQTYIVKAGDTGTKIAAKHGVKWAEIRRASGLKSDTLRAGQKLTIPGHANGAAASRTSEAPAGDSGGGSPAGGLPPTAIPVPRGPGR